MHFALNDCEKFLQASYLRIRTVTPLGCKAYSHLLFYFFPCVTLLQESGHWLPNKVAAGFNSLISLALMPEAEINQAKTAQNQ